jgi:hypothetical protein
MRKTISSFHFISFHVTETKIKSFNIINLNKDLGVISYYQLLLPFCFELYLLSLRSRWSIKITTQWDSWWLMTHSREQETMHLNIIIVDYPLHNNINIVANNIVVHNSNENPKMTIFSLQDSTRQWYVSFSLLKSLLIQIYMKCNMPQSEVEKVCWINNRASLINGICEQSHVLKSFRINLNCHTALAKSTVPI